MPRGMPARQRQHRFVRRACSRAALVLVAGSAMTTAALLPANAAAQTELDREFLALINAAREEARLPPLRFHGVAQASAERWTPEMIAAGRPSHQILERLLMGPIARVGENVGVHQGGVVPMFEGFMESDYHRANILNPSFTHVGIATREGPYQDVVATWTTQVFLRVVARK